METDKAQMELQRSYAVYENPVESNLQQDKSQTTSSIAPNINLGLNYEIIKGLDFTEDNWCIFRKT